MNKKLLYSITLLTFSLFLLNITVRAEDDDSSYERGDGERKFNFFKDKDERKENFEGMKEKYKEKMEERKEDWQAKRAEICENIEERTAEKLEKFEKHKEKNLEMYSKLQVKLSEISTKMEDEGLDVSDFNLDLATLDTMIEDYKTLYQDFIDNLDLSRGFACKDKDDDFRIHLGESKEKLKAIREQRKEIREFYRTTIREDIKDLRAQLANEDEASEEVENSGDGE